MTTPIDNRDFAGIMTTTSPGRTNCLIHAGGGALNDHSHREHRHHPTEGLLIQGHTSWRFPYYDQSEWWQVHHAAKRRLPRLGRLERVERVRCPNDTDWVEYILPSAGSSRCRFNKRGADRRNCDSRIRQRHWTHPFLGSGDCRGARSEQRPCDSGYHAGRCERLAMLGVAA